MAPPWTTVPAGSVVEVLPPILAAPAATGTRTLHLSRPDGEVSGRGSATHGPSRVVTPSPLPTSSYGDGVPSVWSSSDVSCPRSLFLASPTPPNPQNIPKLLPPGTPVFHHKPVVDPPPFSSVHGPPPPKVRLPRRVRFRDPDLTWTLLVGPLGTPTSSHSSPSLPSPLPPRPVQYAPEHPTPLLNPKPVLFPPSAPPDSSLPWTGSTSVYGRPPTNLLSDTHRGPLVPSPVSRPGPRNLPTRHPPGT